MKLNKVCIAVLALSAGSITSAVISSNAVEIPLGPTTGTIIYSSSGTAPAAQSTAGAIGYVDIDRVFREHPLTRRSREDFKQEVEKRRRAIDAMQQSIVDAEKVIVSSSALIAQARAETEALRSPQSPAPLEPKPLSSSTTDFVSVFPTVATSTAAVTVAPVSPDIIRSREVEIKTKETYLEQMKKNAATMKTDIALRIKKDKDDLTLLEEKQTSDVMSDIYFVLEKIAKEENITVVFDKNNILYGQSVRDITDKTLERLKGR